MLFTIGREIRCTLWLGVCFMTMYAAVFTLLNMQKTIVSSIHDEQPEFNVDGYTLSAITYAIFTVVVLFAAPYICLAMGPRLTMFVCCAGSLVSLGVFLLESSWAIYLSTVLSGLSTGILWPAQGHYLIQNSTSENVSRNASIFWFIYTFATLVGNIFVYYTFQGKKYVDGHTRRTALYSFVGINALAVIEFAFLPKSTNKDNMKTIYGPTKTLKTLWNLMKLKRIRWLCVYFIYAGLQQALWNGIYSPSVGFTLAFGDSVKELVALSGMTMSVGSIVASVFCWVVSGLLSNQRHSRRLLVTVGGLASLITFVIIFLNLPDDSVFGNTYSQSFIRPPSIPLALIGGFCSCFGDAVMNTQVYSTLGEFYRDQSTEAYALYKFVKNIFVSLSFFWCNHLGLHTQIAIMAVMTILGVICFWVADWENTTSQCLKEENSPKVIPNKSVELQR